MEISDELRCVFSADVDDQDGSYTVTIPKREITRGEIDEDTTYRVALVATNTKTTDTREPDESQTASNADGDPAPPVEVGERRAVEIEDIGSQGDGIARVERGYVIIVPETEEGDQVVVEITEVKPTVAFGDVVKWNVDAESVSN